MSHSPSSASVVEEIEAGDAVASIRRATGLEFCLKILDAGKRVGSGAAAISADHPMHRTLFCLEVKRTLNAQCIECDLRRVPLLCEERRAPFIHLCHAGASEMIVPVFIEERLAAVAYLGQFRVRKTQPKTLRLLRPEDQRHLLALGSLIQAYLAGRLKTPLFQTETSRGYREVAIRNYLVRNLRNNPGLPALALHLGLSKTRTAHVVAEATGFSFTALRDDIRLERATALLQSTYYNIGQVAFECGFSSTQYFHRFFRRRAGLPPAAFRRQHRIEADRLAV